MPTPDRTSLDEIVAAGRALLESEGLAGLTMQAVATRVGVRAPSLYKRVRNRAELVARVAEAAARELGERLDAAAASAADARERLMVLARTFRGFAHERPAAFGLLFTPGRDLPIDLDALQQASASMLEVAAELSGPEHALDSARTLTAWANGFVSMELAGAFRLGGDVERAFEYGVHRLADALAERPS
ncbi:TetR/AcrR family transcriptional regulator [Agromyces humatus]|uniref:TetR/AcrR family transcriptional regulator n=1 Tax=Agromyces humatus TaxID=279573 RepID=A0ABN2K3F5_9MICO|nr:TetR-like C-terminal domain-containing protein [Agromyces humatus]